MNEDIQFLFEMDKDTEAEEFFLDLTTNISFSLMLWHKEKPGVDFLHSRLFVGFYFSLFQSIPSVYHSTLTSSSFLRLPVEWPWLPVFIPVESLLL